MKRCEHCEWWHSCAWFGWFKYGCNLPYPLANCIANDRSEYVRKWQLCLAWWIPKVLLLTLALLFTGCGVEAEYTDKDGRMFKYRRTGAQQIGEVLLEFPDGTMFLMDGQKSELPPVEITATSIIIGKEVRP